MSFRGKCLTGLLVVAALTFAAALPGAAQAGVHFKKCGKVPRLGVEVEAAKVSCGKAIRIVAAYKHSGVGKGFTKRVPGFPGWKCSSGDRLGSCSRGSYAPSAPQVVFPYLQAPGRHLRFPVADRRLLARPVGIFTAKGPSGRLAACDMYIPESRKRGVLCASAIAGSPGHFREAMLLASGRVHICSDTTECGWVFDDPDPGPTFGPGHVVKDPPFRCRVMSRAVRCTVSGSGHGFLINAEEAREIGPKSGSSSRTAADARRSLRRRGSKHCGPLKVGGTKVRFQLSGKVSCETASSVYTAYVRKASRGQCEGNGCSAIVKGWDCVENISVPVQEETGEVANCVKKGSGIRVFGTKS